MMRVPRLSQPPVDWTGGRVSDVDLLRQRNAEMLDLLKRARNQLAIAYTQLRQDAEVNPTFLSELRRYLEQYK